MAKQTTISKDVIVEGIGLHTGNKSKIIFKPAQANYGIHFVRVDLPGNPDLTANWQNLSDEVAIRGTIIENNGVKMYTVEHILAICSALKIDNLIVEIDNNEPPISDGSAKLLAQTILSAGIKELDAQREYYIIKEPVSFTDGKTTITAYPSDKFEIDCTIGFEHPFLANQQGSFVITEETFINDIAPSRTFCFDFEIEALQANGLAKGGSLENAVVIGPAGIYNKEPLRYQDEFVRHKTLDLIGDLYLLGKQIKAKIVAVKPGHKNNGMFVKEFVKKAILVKDENKAEDKVQEHIDGERIINSAEIQTIIPHRYPILMVDRVKLTGDIKKATGYKAVSGNEGFFRAIFPVSRLCPAY